MAKLARGVAGFARNLSEGMRLLIALKHAEEERDRSDRQRKEDVEFRERQFGFQQEEAGRARDERRQATNMATRERFEGRVGGEADRYAKAGVFPETGDIRSALQGAEVPESIDLPGSLPTVEMGGFKEQAGQGLASTLREAETAIGGMDLRGGVRALPSGGFVHRAPLQSVESASLRVDQMEPSWQKLLRSLANDERTMAMLKVFNPALYEQVQGLTTNVLSQGAGGGGAGTGGGQVTGDPNNPRPGETAQAYADRVGPTLGGAEARRRWTSSQATRAPH